MLRKKINKKAQIGETITWLVATIVIVVILLFFIFSSTLLANKRKVGEVRESLKSKPLQIQEDYFLSKSIYSYLYFTKNSPSEKELRLKVMKLFPKSFPPSGDSIEPSKLFKKREVEIKSRLYN